MVKNTQPRANTKSVEKISLNFPGNFGRYQILPLDSVVTDYPYVTLFNTREIAIPRKQVGADGTETPYTAWVKLLPKEGYQMKDMTGRVVSSLTADEEQLLGEAHTLFDNLFTEVDARNNLQMQRDLCRKRNYTLFHAMCLNKWDFEDSRAPKRQNFCGLFVCTAKGFMQAVEDNINERTLMNGGDASWLQGIYNRDLTGRDGFIMFSISKSKTSAGYTCTVSHETGRAQMLSGVTIPAEDAEMMKDPVETFLGWQANREDNVEAGQKRLFNANLVKEAIAFMTSQLAAIRLNKQNGQSIEDAIKATNELALKNAVVAQPKTNDPMLQQAAAAAPQVNAERVVEQNTNPFTSPAASHLDPITGAPVAPSANPFGTQPQAQPQAAPFTAPSFGGFGSAPKTDLPF
jgi:hypothetical protein